MVSGLLTALRTHTDEVETRFAFAMHGAQGVLQDLPGDCFAAARLAHDHGGVA